MKNKIDNTFQEKLTPEGIDNISEWLVNVISDTVSSKEVTRTRLAAEEALLIWQEKLGEDKLVFVRRKQVLGKGTVILSVDGPYVNPYEASDAEDELGRNLLVRLDLSPSFAYKGSRNSLSIPIQGKKSSPIIAIVIAAILGVIVGMLLLQLPGSVSSAIAQNVVDPLVTKMMYCIRLAALPMIFFSVAVGILQIGDISLLGKIGKTIFRPILLDPIVAASIGVLAVIWMVPITSSTGSSGAAGAKTIFDMILNIIPNDLISPFIDGNALQIIFLAIFIGIAFLTLGEISESASAVMSSINSAFGFLMSLIIKLMPLLIFLSLVSMTMSGALSKISSVAVVIILYIICTFVISTFGTVHIMIKYKVPFKILLQKHLPPFLLEISTASSAASLMARLEAVDKLGIDKSFSSFAVPLFQVLYKTAAAVEFSLVTLGLAPIFGLSVTFPDLVMLVIMAGLLSMAVPPVPGGSIMCLTLMCAQLGLPEEGVTLCILVNMIADYFLTASHGWTQLDMATVIAGKLKLLDVEQLRK